MNEGTEPEECEGCGKPGSGKTPKGTKYAPLVDGTCGRCVPKCDICQVTAWRRAKDKIIRTAINDGLCGKCEKTWKNRLAVQKEEILNENKLRKAKETTPVPGHTEMVSAEIQHRVYRFG